MSDRLLICLAITVILVGMISQARGHQPYNDWLMPDGGKCCTDLQRECRPVRSWWDEERERFVIVVDGQERIVPPAAIIDKPSPDGRSHACIGPVGTIFCFVAGKPKI